MDKRIRIVGWAVPTNALYVFVLLLLLTTPVLAQETSLIDILRAKGVLSQEDLQKLRASSGKGGSAEADQQALISLLKAKGILNDQDLAKLKSPVVAPSDVNERLTRIEAEQKAQAEQQAKAVEELKKTAVADLKKNIDWLNRFSFFGDIRVRHEGFYQDKVNARNRYRIRLRIGSRLHISDELEGGVRLVIGDPNEIVANNQTMTDVFTRKPINIDNAYITFRPGKSFGLEKSFFSLTAGKFSVNFFRPRAVMGSELLFDEDLSPEGAAEELTLFEGKDFFRSLKVAAGQWSIKEFFPGRDSYMLGEQVQLTVAPTAKSQLTLALADYYFGRSDAIAQERNRNAQLVLTNSVRLRNGQIVRGGNLITTNTNNPIQGFAGGFHIVNASGQLTWDTGYARWPLSFMFDYAHNVKAKFGKNDAYLIGAGIGQTRNPGDWAFSALWTRVETDAVISMFTLSDYGRRGGTNVQGPIAKIDYMLLPRLTLTAKGYFVNLIDRPTGLTNSTVNRVQFDALFAF
jgi:hypothetical protein